MLLKSTDQAQVYLGELAEAGYAMKPPRRLTNDEAEDYPYGMDGGQQNCIVLIKP